MTVLDVIDVDKILTVNFMYEKNLTMGESWRGFGLEFIKKLK